MLDTLRRNRYTTSIFVLVLLLSGLGLVMVYSSSAVWAAKHGPQPVVNRYEAQDTGYTSFHSPQLLIKQTVWIGLGLVALFAFYSINYEAVTRHRLLILGLALGLLIAVLIPGIGSKINGARRWLDLGVMNFQPSEFAKLALVVFLSKYLFDRRDRLNQFKAVFLPSLAVLVVVAGLLLAEPDFGATVVIGAIFMAIWFMAGVPLRYLLGLAASGVPALIVLAVASPYRLKRLIIMFDPTADPLGAGWQSTNALISVGSGGLWGKGFGQGLQKYFYMREAHNDFIFAMIGEELGLIGSVATIAAFCLLVGLIFWVAYRAIDFQGALLACGVGSMIAIPVIVHIGVVLAMLPPKGIALPFVSYGGSSMLMNLAAVGILMNVARGVDKQAAERSRHKQQRRLRERDNLRPTPVWAKS